MKTTRVHSTFRILVLALTGAALTACHFHGHGWGHCGHFYRPVRVCR